MRAGYILVDVMYSTFGDVNNDKVRFGKVRLATTSMAN